MHKPQFVENKLYHIYNRGVEKRKIFMDDKDHFRFIHDLFEFNDENPALNAGYFFDPKAMKIRTNYIKKVNKKEAREPRKLLVEILIFTLMPNHYHLILKQKKENGIIRFMQKLGTGYTNYFNKKYERVGPLFQGKFKAVILEEHAHFLHLPYYIHTNPLELSTYGSRTSVDWKNQMEFLENYRWSSFMDYAGEKNFPSVTQREFLLDFFGGEKEYKKETKKWLKERSNNTQEIKEITLD